MVMDDTAKDQMILIVMAEQKGGHTAKQISKLTERYEAPVSVRDVATRLPHLAARSYVFQDLSNPLVYHIMPAGIMWAEQNRGKR